MITGVTFPARRQGRRVSLFSELSRRHGDFAIVGIGGEGL